jgi:HK97 family phage major capsid protein
MGVQFGCDGGGRFSTRSWRIVCWIDIAAAWLAVGIRRQQRNPVPGVVASATGVDFVKQSDPIAVRQLALSGPTLTSKKLSSVSVLTRETFEHSTPTIESLVRAALGEGISLALDAALFANTPGDEVTPEGLLYNVVPLSASSAAAKTDAIIEDLQALVAAVAPIAGNVPIIIVASPAQYVAARLVLGGRSRF